MKRTERLHAISESLRRSGARGQTAERLADEFGVTVRTIKRDLDALKAAGTPIWSQPGPGGGYGAIPGTTLPPISLSPTQAMALLATISASPIGPFTDLAAAGIRKIADALDTNIRQEAEQLANRIWINDPTPTSREIWSPLEQAMVDRRVLHIRYQSLKDETTNRAVEPILLACTNNQWYLIAWCQLRQAVRWFAVARIHKATVTTNPCSPHSLSEVGTPPPTAHYVTFEP